MGFLFPAPSPDVTLQRVAKEAILYDRRGGQAHVINDSAARVWELCDGRTTLNDIVNAFAAMYGLPPADVHDDVVSIMTSFAELQMLAEADGKQ